MKTYAASGLEDIKLYRWWETMVLTGDLQRGYTGLDKLSSFFNAMQPPTQLLYEENESGIWFAMWMEPQTAFGGAFVNAWVAAEARQTKRALRAVLVAFKSFLAVYPVLVAVTGSEALSFEYEKFGFLRLGEIPVILGSELAYVMVLTHERFEEATKNFEPLMYEVH